MNIVVIFVFGISALAAGTLTRTRLTKSFRRRQRVVTYSIIALTILTCISLLVADNTFRVGRPLLSYLNFFFILFATSVLAFELRVKDFLHRLLLAAIFVSLVAALANFITPLQDQLFGERDRTGAFFKNPNQFGIALSCVGPLMLSLAITAKKGKPTYAIGTAVLVVALVSSGSKTNLLVFAASCVLVMVTIAISERSGLRSYISLVLNALLAVVLLLIGLNVLEVLNPRAANLIYTFLSAEGEVRTVSQRMLLWQQGIQEGMQRPLLGAGAGQTTVHPLTGEIYPHSHNAVVDYFRTLGVPGLLFSLLMMGSVLMFSLRSLFKMIGNKSISKCDKGYVIGLSIGVIAYIVSNQVSDSFGPSTSPIFWTLFICLFYVQLHTIGTAEKHFKVTTQSASDIK